MMMNNVLDVHQWFFASLHITLLYSLITLFHLLLPAKIVRGYVSDGPSFYRLNGLTVFLLLSSLFIVLIEYLQWIDINYLIDLRYHHACCACLLGLILTLILVLPNEKNTTSFWLDVYLGRVKNPQWFF